MLNSTCFHPENTLSREEKFALLSFMALEFNLLNSLIFSGQNLNSIAEFQYNELFRHKTKIDLIWIECYKNFEFDTSLVVEIRKLLSKKAIVCIDGEDKQVKKVRYILGDTFVSVLDFPSFTILARRGGERSVISICYQIDLFRRKFYFEKVHSNCCSIKEGVPSVTVIILTYNHEKYISECLNSVFMQQGDFRMRVIIIDDASSDKTADVVRKIVNDRNDDHLSIEFYINSENRGVVKNLFTSVQIASGCDYMTFCEGDDFWSSESRIREHIEFLSNNQKCVMSFNAIEFCRDDGSSRRINNEHASLNRDILDGNALAESNFIGNFSACFYHGSIVKILPKNLFDLYTVDWLFNLYCSQFGSIGYLKKVLTVYRQHDGAEWSSRREFDKADCLGKLIEQYNLFLDFQYDRGFQKYRKMLFGYMSIKYPEVTEKIDLLILDDVFPAPYSGFRFAEFTTYLKEFPRSLVLTSGVSVFVLGIEPIEVLSKKFQRKYPELGNQIMESNGGFPIKLAKIAYVNFLNNAYALLSIAEEARVPFAFTLYPGGGFVLRDPECDRKLKRIFNSPCFRKVIVTQQITYDYIISKCLCPPEKVDFIFGVVMPQDSFVYPIPEGKLRWGFGKKQLDICFMAHRYTPCGEDKGYDVFINTACQLHKLHDDIYYHIVGPFDHRVIDISPIYDRIQFHGTINPEALDDFFKDMDIILSPNISGKILPGSFDGFPTASCTEGGLRGVAIFCTDEFNSARGTFVDGQDFVLINYDVADIVHKVEHYYLNPAELKVIGEFGSQKILNLYSYESQIEPRIRILRELIDSPFVFDLAKWGRQEQCTPVSQCNPLISKPVPSPLWAYLKRHCPEPLKNIYRKFVKQSPKVNYVR